MTGILTALLMASAVAAQTGAPAQPKHSFGQPVPLSQRPVTLPQWGFEVDIRYGLVGNGPTRFVDDIRFAPLDWLELRTALNPYPDSLMLRLAWGKLDQLGVVSIDGGLYKLDLGLRLDPAEAAQVAGLVVGSVGGGLAYDRAVTSRGRLHVKGRVQQRISNEGGLDQTVVMGAAWGDVDLARFLGLSLGLGYGQVVAGEVRDFTVNFAEVGRSGFSTMLDRDNDRSATAAFGLTYARTESFDVDLIATLRYWPEPGSIMGAGLRWRL